MEQLSLIPIDNETLKPGDYWVTKANILVEASYRLSLVQQRIVLVMASLVEPEDEDFKWYRLSVKDFMEILGIHSHNLYYEMIAAVHNLMEKVITISVDDQVILKTHWINDALYRVGVGYVDVAFSPKLKPFFLHLKNKFTTYKLENVMHLKSFYSIRIYELLKQYQGIGKRTITVSDLKKILGIEPKEYKQYGHFKDRVLAVAYKEINEKTDICFDFKEIKLSRKVNELEFTIYQKAPPPKLDKAAKQREEERERQECEAKKKAQQRERVEKYLAQLSVDELKALKEEAERVARQEGGQAFRERNISEHIINGYIHTIVEKRLKTSN